MSEQATISDPTSVVAGQGGVQDGAGQASQAAAPFAGSGGGQGIFISDDKLANVANRRDVNALVHRILEYDAMERDGFTNLAKVARQRQLNGHRLVGQLEERNWDFSQPAPPAAAEPPPAPAAQFPPFAGMEAPQVPLDPNNPFAQLPVTQQDMMRFLDERDKRWETKWTAEEERRQKAERDRQDQDQYRSHRAEEDKAYDLDLKELGYERKAVRQQWLGREAEVDLLYDKVLKPIIQNAAADYFDIAVHADDPRRNLPAERQYIPPELVREVVQFIKPLITALQYQAAAEVTQKSAGFPQASLPPGPGGRPQKAAEDMSEDERRAEGFRQARAQGARLRGI